MSLRIVNSSGGTRTLAFPAGWTFISNTPSDIANSKTGILSINCYGDLDTDVVCAYAFEA
jgi:hypothetical protein